MGKKNAERPAHRTRHLFFLNPYSDVAFTKCPKCEGKTRQRKLPLVIHIEPNQMLVLNKTCRYCPSCDLVIARQSELEPLMAAAFTDRRPGVVGNEYLVVGTLDRSDWSEQTRGTGAGAPKDVLQRTWVFKDQLHFRMTGGWMRAPG
jgi:hypothetical protein